MARFLLPSLDYDRPAIMRAAWAKTHASMAYLASQRPERRRVTTLRAEFASSLRDVWDSPGRSSTRSRAAVPARGRSGEEGAMSRDGAPPLRLVPVPAPKPDAAWLDAVHRDLARDTAESAFLELFDGHPQPEEIASAAFDLIVDYAVAIMRDVYAAIRLTDQDAPSPAVAPSWPWRSPIASTSWRPRPERSGRAGADRARPSVRFKSRVGNTHRKRSRVDRGLTCFSASPR